MTAITSSSKGSVENSNSIDPNLMDARFNQPSGTTQYESRRSGFLRERWPIMVVVLAGVAVLLPIIIRGIPSGADLFNHYRFALPFYESIREGRLYPGWLAESNAGLGDPRFRFYPPGLYYLLAVMKMLTSSWYWGSITAFSFLSVTGSLGIYFWARQYCSPKTAMLAGILFAITPYRLNEIYQASLLSEYAACAVLPFAFAFTDRICRGGTRRDVAGLSVSYALLILTHLPLTLIGSISLFVFALVRLKKGGMTGTLMRLAAGVVLALAVSAFFWVDMLVELPWIKGSSKVPNIYYDYRLNFLFSPAALTNRNNWYGNLLALAVIGFSLPAIALVRRKGHFSHLKVFGVVMLFSLFMTTELSRPLWAILPKLSEVQFPWRWLAITSITGVTLTAVGIQSWYSQARIKFQPRNLVIPFGFVLALFFIGSEVIQDTEYLHRQAFESLLPDIRGAVSFKDWLPTSAQGIVNVSKMSDKVEAEGRNVTITSWEPEHRTFEVGQGAPVSVHVHTYFYPHWVANAKGKDLSIVPANDGTILIAVPADAVRVTLDFREPPRSLVSTIVSILACLVLGGIVLTPRRKPTAAPTIDIQKSATPKLQKRSKAAS